MRKLRSDSKLAGLTPGELDMLDDWYFNHNHGHEEVHRRAVEWLKFAGSISSLKRWYARRRQERLTEDMSVLREDSEEIASAAVNPDALRASAMKLLTTQFFRLVQEDAVTDPELIARLLLKHEANCLKREQLELTRQREVARLAKWQYNAVDNAIRNLDDLIEIREERAEEDDRFYENKKLNRIRRRLFGPDIPEPYVENEEEEAEMLDAVARGVKTRFNSYEADPGLAEKARKFDNYFAPSEEQRENAETDEDEPQMNKADEEKESLPPDVAKPEPLVPEEPRVNIQPSRNVEEPIQTHGLSEPDENAGGRGSA